MGLWEDVEGASRAGELVPGAVWLSWREMNEEGMGRELTKVGRRVLGMWKGTGNEASRSWGTWSCKVEQESFGWS